MLYYRFSEWNFPPKYKRLAVSNDRTHLDLPLVPTRALDLYGGSGKLHAALASVGNYLDDICEVKFWCLPGSTTWIEIQWLISSTHMAVNSVVQHHDVHAAWTELRAMESRVEQIMLSLCNSVMHPRVLSALFRLLVNGSSCSDLQVRTLSVVRAMFAKVSKVLPANHPVRMLCGLPNDIPSGELLSHFFGLVERRLYGKTSCSAPDFVAREQIYNARVLASLGRIQEADAQLEMVLQVIENPQIKQLTRADCYRTAGYSKAEAGTPEAARPFCENALRIFDEIGEGQSENAMFTHLTLARCSRQEGDLENCEYHSHAAFAAWESNAKFNRGQGGVKFVRDLYQVYQDRGKISAMEQLCAKYPKYFEESKET